MNVSEINVISYGSGAGLVLHTIKREVRHATPDVVVKTTAADYDQQAIELARRLNPMASQNERIDHFQMDDLRCLEDQGSYDVILLEDVLHEVFSFADSTRAEDGSIRDVESNKKVIVERVFPALAERLKPGGILIIEERFKPDEDENKIVEVHFKKKAVQDDLYQNFFVGSSYQIKKEDGTEETVHIKPFTSIPVTQLEPPKPDGEGGLTAKIRFGDYLHFLSYLRVLVKEKNV